MLYCLGRRGTLQEWRKTVVFLQKNKVLLPRFHVRIFKHSRPWGHIRKRFHNRLTRQVVGRHPRKVA